MREAGSDNTDMMSVIRPTVPIEQPPVPRKLCARCGSMMDESLQGMGAVTHVGCRPRISFEQPVEDPSLTHPMREHLIELIRWHDSTKARALQAVIGPSEMGSSCDRRLAMRIANVRKLNRVSDPWPAIVGTAIHDWLERCLKRVNSAAVARGGQPEWITEKRVQLDPVIVGISDAYYVPTNTVVDWKSMGESAEKRLIAEGPGYGYFSQIQGYGLGFHRLGFPVRKVGLMFLPRSGKLSQARYYEWDFDPSVAQRAIERVYRLGRFVLQLRQHYQTEEIWHHIPADPTALCGWCPFFRSGSGPASSTGCPGR